MARPTFSLEIDGEDPSNHARPSSQNSTVLDVNPVKFANALATGKLKIIGLLLGELPGSGLDVECSEPAQAQLVPPAGNCIVVYVGGTAYKICR